MILPVSKLYPIISSLEKSGSFQELERIYSQIPETTCGQCATCCTVPPPGYFIEYLYMLRHLRDNLKEERADILKKMAQYYFLEMVDINSKCPFLSDENKCLIYPVRALSCRAYGLMKNRNERPEDNMAMELLARDYKEKHGIELPRQIVEFRLPANCDKVKITDGSRLSKGTIERSITEIARMESEILPADFVEQERSLMPYVNYLAYTVLSEGAQSRRIKVMKEFMDKGSSDLLEEYKEKAGKYEF